MTEYFTFTLENKFLNSKCTKFWPLVGQLIHSYVKPFPSIPIGMNLFHMVILIITDFDYNKLPQEFMLYT